MRHSRSITCAVIVILAVGLSATAASARQPDRQFLPSSNPGFGDLPAGVACAFPVSLNPVQPYPGNQLTFFDHNGDVVHQATTVGPSTWTITNLDTDASYIFAVAAARVNITPHDDGSVTVELSGGIVGFNAPTDTPPGPFALTFSGRLVLDIAADGAGTIIQQSGTSTDLCATVAP
jgi:hypothetical protein